jgi:hypothetical protein
MVAAQIENEAMPLIVRERSGDITAGLLTSRRRLPLHSRQYMLLTP